MTKVMQIRVLPAHYAALEQFARQRGRTVSDVVREALAERFFLPSGATESSTMLANEHNRKAVPMGESN